MTAGQSSSSGSSSKPVKHVKSRTADIVREYAATVIVASLAMAAGTAWSRALSEMFGVVGENTKNKVYKMVMVAGTATLLAAICALWFSENESDEEQAVSEVVTG